MKAIRYYIGSNKKDRFKVTIFGSSRVKRNDPVYNQIKALAQGIGERGFDIVTGGGPGLMEAATLGHKEGSRKTKAHSIGLNIKLSKEQHFNKGVEYGEIFRRFSQRLDRFVLLSNAVVVAPGGVGTLLELFYTWQLVQVKHVSHIPIILLGDQWPELLDWLENWPMKSKYFSKEDLYSLFLANDADEAMKVIDLAYENYKNGKKDFTLKYKEYKIKD